jgi:hypothetical protein
VAQQRQVLVCPCGNFVAAADELSADWVVDELGVMCPLCQDRFGGSDWRSYRGANPGGEYDSMPGRGRRLADAAARALERTS